MNLKLFRFLTVCILLLAGGRGTAQQVRLYTSEDGLVNSLINSVYQDSRGYIWISTENGLAYFDGMNFSTFHHNRNREGALSSNLVLTVFEDSRHTLWVGSSAPELGLQQFDYESNTFRNVPLESSPSISAGMHVSAIAESPDGRELVVATSGRGLFVLRTGDYEQETARGEELSALLPSPYVARLFFDRKGRLWVASEETGFCLIDFASGKRCEVAWSPELTGVARQLIVSAIADDEETGHIVIGTLNHGVLIYDDADGCVRRARGKEAAQLRVKAFCPSPDGKGLLVGTELQGLRLFDPATERSAPVTLPNSRFDIGSAKVHAVTGDNQGNVWLGIYQKGLMVLPRTMYGFESVPLHPDDLPGRNLACVTSVLCERSGDLWVGTDGGGIFVLHENGARSRFTAGNSGLPNDAVITMTQDRHGTVWVSTYMGGVAAWRPGTGFRPLPTPAGTSNAKVMNSAYDAGRDLLYLGTYGDGVNVVNVATGEVSRLKPGEVRKWIGSLLLDRAGLLWIGTFDGVQCYDTRRGEMLKYHLGEIASSSRIYSFCQSARSDVLWIGSGEGLAAYDRRTGESKLYTMADGLPGNVINAIEESGDGNLWISTCNGLSRFNPERGEFRNYYACDGLQSDEFRYGAAAVASDGRMYFGGINGLTSFYPHIVEQGVHPVPPINFSRLSVLNRTVTYDPEATDNILDKHITQAGEITLRKDQNVFDIEFSVLEYTNPHKIVYAYMMQGFDNDWTYTRSDNRVATYTNLPDGRYVFRVKAFFEGAEHDDPAYRELKIRILPPPWKTWWACTIYIVLFLLGVGALLMLWRRHRIRVRERAESEKKDMKLQMFTDFSHEIRTPLTLVIAPLRELRASEGDPRRRELYNLMYRNSLRIQRLVNQLLDIRKIDNGRLKLNYFKTDLIFFVRDIMHSFDHAAASKHIAFTFACECESLEVWIDQSNFDKVLFNILSNAFKYTPEEGRVSLALTTHGNDRRSGVDPAVSRYVELRVENSGSEIEPRFLEHVFDRFFQIENSGHYGSGIGLNLAKKLVELHRGAISAENTADGVAFTVRLPLGSAHLAPDEILPSAKHKDLYMNLRQERPSEAVEGLDYDAAQRASAEAKTSRTKRNIVLVDDDVELGKYLKMELSGLYNVEVFPNGKDAWKAVSATIPDAIVTDLVMPQMGGLELCRKVKQNMSTNHIPVIILTSQTDDESVQMCMDSGADRFLTKPISLELLKGGIAQAIATRDTIRNKYRNEVDAGYDEVKMGSSDDRLVGRVVETIRRHLEDPDFSVDDLSREVGMSRVHLNRKLKERISTSPSNLIRSIRLKQAAFLLINHKVNISEVAYKVGFSTHSYFSNSFRDYFGMTPKEFVAKYMDCTDEETLRKFFD